MTATPLLAIVLLLVTHAAVGAQPIVTVRNRHIVLRDDNVQPVDPSRRYLRVRVGTRTEDAAHRVVLPLAGSDGDPTPGGATGGGGTLTVYNANGGGEQVTYSLAADSWYRSPFDPIRVYQYKGGGPGLSPIRKIYVRPDKIYMEGKGPLLSYTLDEPSQGRIAVRLTLGSGVTFCAEGGPREPASLNDRVDTFRGVTTSAPTVCPPLPGE